MLQFGRKIFGKILYLYAVTTVMHLNINTY